jgi:hypothetical protein
MNIRLKPETEEWLKAQVAAGRYPSVEEAVEILLVAARIGQAPMNNPDLAWAKHYIDDGTAPRDTGGTIPSDEVQRELLSRVKTSEQKWIID